MITDSNGNNLKRDECECRKLYKGHKRCKGCTMLIHLTRDYGNIGFSENGVTCTNCILPQKKTRVPKEKQAPTQSRKEYLRNYWIAKYHNDPVYRELRKAKQRAQHKARNEKYVVHMKGGLQK